MNSRSPGKWLKGLVGHRVPDRGDRTRRPVVAAITVVSLAPALLGLVVHPANAVISRTFAPRSAAASAHCSKATAVQLVNQHQLNAFLAPSPVSQVLCGSFTGPGSDAMAVTIVAPTCWPVQNWALFSYNAGAWQLVFHRAEFLASPLAASGADLRVTTPVFRPSDNRCNPSGGTRTTIWRWNGARLVAGKSHQGTSPTTKTALPTPPKAKLHLGYLKTPSANIECDYAWGGQSAQYDYIRCGLRSGLTPTEPIPAGGCGTDSEYTGNRVTLRLTAPGVPEPCSGDAGPFADPSIAKTLPYGTTWKGGSEFTCVSESAGLTCHSNSGHGFFLSRASWKVF